MEQRPTKAQAWHDLVERFLSPVCAAFEQLVVSNGAVKRAWRRRSGAALLAFPLITLLTGCGETREEQKEATGKAYGDTWVYSKTEIATRYRALFSPHGLFGVRNAYRERHVIRNSAGNTISIPDNLYALQRNGTLKKVECCQYFREKGDLRSELEGLPGVGFQD